MAVLTSSISPASDAFAAKAINYQGVGTIEFIVDGSGELRADGFWFMEMNTRLQVEHPVTEAITGVDLAEWQLRVASGEPIPKTQAELGITGHAFEARLYAEDVAKGFLPATSTIEHLVFGDARIDSGVVAGDEISPFYDPMIAKLTSHGATRKQALSSLRRALQQTHVVELTTNVSFLHALVSHSGFIAGKVDTGLIERDIDQLSATDVDTDLPMAIAAIALREPAAKTQTAAFRLWGDASERVLLSDSGNELIELRVNYLDDGLIQVALPESHVEFKQVEFTDGAVKVLTRDHLLRIPCVVTSTRDGRSVSVMHKGFRYQYFCPDPLIASANNNNHADDVRAPMTGVIRAILVAQGNEVSVGQNLLVLEAMKMEHTLFAPRDGKVVCVNCEVQGQVSDGAILLQLEALTEKE